MAIKSTHNILALTFFSSYVGMVSTAIADCYTTVTNSIAQLGPILSTTPYTAYQGVGLNPATLSLDSQGTPAYNPYMCVTTTSYIQPPDPSNDSTSTGPTSASDNEYWYGFSLRYGPANSVSSSETCSDSATYIGYGGFSLSDYCVAGAQDITLSPSAGIHLNVSSFEVSDTGDVSGTVEMTDIDVNTAMTSVQSNKSYWKYPGINLSGNEFSNFINAYTIPNLSEQDSDTSQTDLANTNQFIADGIQVVRLPINWGYLLWYSENTNGDTTVPTASAAAGTAAPYRWAGASSDASAQDISPMFNKYIAPTIASLTSAGITVIVDLHSYMRYPAYGSQYTGCTSYSTVPCPDGTLMTENEYYTDIWGAIYQALTEYTYTDSSGNTANIDMSKIMLDLANEPTLLSGNYASSDTSGDMVFTIQANLINYLQNTLGFDGTILVEGNHWSGLHSWPTFTWSMPSGTTSSYCTETNNCPDGTSVCCSNANLFTKANFNLYATNNNTSIDTSKILINPHQYLDAQTGFSGTSDTCSTDLSTTDDNAGGGLGFNLDAFVAYLQTAELNAIVTEFGGGLASGDTNSPTCAIAIQQFMDYMAANLPGEDENGNPIYGFEGWTIWSTGHGWGTSYNLLVTPDSYQWNIIKPYLTQSNA